MKEYNEALQELRATMAVAQAALAVKVLPVFHKRFAEFFEKYPEFESISWVVRSDVYNDETYEDNIEDIGYTLSEECVPECVLGYDSRVLDIRITKVDLEIAEGKFPKYYNEAWYDDKYRERIRQTTLKQIGTAKLLDEHIGADRRAELCTAWDNMEDFIQNTDIEFHVNVFGYEEVTVTKEGFGS